MGVPITKFSASITIDDENYIANMEKEIAIIDNLRLFVGSYSINLSYKVFYFKNANEKKPYLMLCLQIQILK